MSGLGKLSTLPAELHLQIYSYVLFDKNQEISVVSTINRRLSEKAERQRILRLNHHATEVRPSRPVGVKNSLLYVSKQVSQEACQVLYGGHKFELGTAQALDWFLVLIGENRQYIRHVCVIGELGMRTLPAVGCITDNLLQAKDLRSLTLRPKIRVYVDLHGSIIRFFGDADIARSQIGAFITKLALVSEKLLRSLHRAQESDDKLAGVVEIFSLDLSAFGIAQEQLSAFWQSAVNSRINEST
ncbi:hypothetical protein MBLNU13_g02259t2 [Cladosporium sp. NU13]